MPQIVIMPVFVSSLCFCVLEARRRLTAAAFLTRWFRIFAMVVLLCFGELYFLSWLYKDVSRIRLLRSRNELFREVEHILIEQGATDLGQVFTDDFDLYLPGTPPYRPLHNGGWVKYSLHAFAERYPDMPTDSVLSFSEACRDRDIRFLVLTDRSSNLADFLYRLYRDGHDKSQILGDFVAEVGPYKIFDTRR